MTARRAVDHHAFQLSVSLFIYRCVSAEVFCSSSYASAASPRQAIKHSLNSLAEHGEGLEKILKCKAELHFI